MTRDDAADRSDRFTRRSRRAVLAAGTAGLAGLAGCFGSGGGDGSEGEQNTTTDTSTTTDAGTTTGSETTITAGTGTTTIGATNTTDAGTGTGTSTGTGTPGTATATAGGADGSSGASGAALPIEVYRGSGPLVERRPSLSGTSIRDLPPLSGELTIYLGGGEGGLYTSLVELLRRTYPDFAPRTRLAPTSQLANTIIQETSGGSSPADVFWSVDAGSLGVVAERGVTVPLPQRVVDSVPQQFHPREDWVGVAGRARSVPFNTNQLQRSQIPEDVLAFTNASGLQGNTGWAPTYGAFQAFITAMRLLTSRERTKRWLNGMQDQGIGTYPDEFLVSNAVADGEIAAGFANHYYALRVQAARPDAPIDLAFTEGGPGALINVSGAEIIQGTRRRRLATNFIHHLLTVEAQEFFATRAFGYPMIPGVPPVGGLPTIDELQPPPLDLARLSDLQPTLRLMREAGVL
jgi:iron(III) transport system substrate-binding protein